MNRNLTSALLFAFLMSFLAAFGAAPALGQPAPQRLTEAKSAAVPAVPDFNPTTLYFTGNLNDGCLGVGTLDIALCGGPWLRETGTPDLTIAGAWVASGVLDGTNARNIYDPSFLWNLDQPTTLQGPMTVQWWAGCALCGVLNAEWNIRLFADDVLVQTWTVQPTPELPVLTSFLSTTVTISPQVSANSNFVLHVDPVYIDAQLETIVFYDSALLCPNVGTGVTAPCESLVIMPVTSGTPTAVSLQSFGSTQQSQPWLPAAGMAMLGAGVAGLLLRRRQHR